MDQIDLINKNYDNYLNYNDKNLSSNIYNKAEFNTKIKNEKLTCDIEKFKLKPNQIFLKNYVSNNTPYRSILLFHGTGTGKTCSAVTIAENFKDIYNRQNKKIIILSPKNVVDNWKNTIFDPNKNQNQCTTDSYYKLLKNSDNIKNETRKEIKKYYEFIGYRKFSNLISKMLKIDIKNDQELTYKELEYIKLKIRTNFNDRVLIIDEVHNIRSDTDSKDILKILKLIVKYSKNMKLILLSATPMFNSAVEIVTLLNIMIWNNDDRDFIPKNKSLSINTSDIFDKDNNITESGQRILKDKLMGYVSYIRGGDKDTFPLRLYPINTINYPDKNYKNEELIEENKLKFLKLYGNKLDIFKNKQISNKLTQTDIYYNELTDIISKDNLQIGDEIKFMQISNMTYPFLKNNIGKIGLKSTMDINNENENMKISYKKSTLSKYGPIFDLKNIGTHSTKIESIINIIKKSVGIVFIYSQFVYGGIIPLMLALEQEGYGKYNSDGILNYDKKNKPISHTGERLTSSNKSKFKQAKYIVLSANNDISKNNEDEILATKSISNMNGENIKIIIGSVVASEGIDFKNIRTMHIMDSWHHLNRLEQIIGRGIRYCSHINLPEEERNVLVYNHVLETHDNKNETIDMHIYKNAEKKSIQIGIIETIMKENSVDCNLFKDMNVSKSLKEKKYLYPVYNEDGTRKIYIDDGLDKKYSKICSYSENCDYNCQETIKKDKKNYDTFDKALFKPVFYNICDYIKQLYENKLSYKLEELTELLYEKINCDIQYIYMALNVMINEKNFNTILNINEIKGYLEYKGEYYIFKPLGNNKNEPFCYRYNIKEKREKYIVDKKTKKKDKKKSPAPNMIVKTDDIGSIGINIDISDLNIYFNKEYIGNDKFIYEFDIYILKSYIIERLSVSIKIQYLSHILKKINQHNVSTLNDDDLHIYNYFKRNFIYNGESLDLEFPYCIDIPDLSINPIGFYLYNKTKFEYYLLINENIEKISDNDEKIDEIKLYLEYYKLQKEFIERYITKPYIWSYIYLNTKNKYIFKLVSGIGLKNLPGIRSKGHVDCNGQNTGDVSSDFIKNIKDKKYNNSSTEQLLSKPFIRRNIKCIYTELSLRSMSEEEKKPYIYNYDNVFLMKI